MADALWDTRLTEDQRSYLQTMRANGDALLQLIDDILDLAKVEAGQLTLEQTKFDLDDLIAKCAGALGVRAHGKRLELIVRIMPDVARMLVGDPLRLRQVLVNLLGNAIKFTAKGEVVLTVELAGPAKRRAKATGAGGEPTVTLHFTVTDTGIGIPRDKLDSVFERFAQADSSTSRKFGGTGLGLAIVKGLTELLGGRVWVESAPGQGSAFHFTAVLGIESPATGPSVPARDIAGARILVADDTAVNRLVVRETLTRLGAEVDEAASGAEALDRIAQAQAAGHPYGLVLLDSRMPGMDGFEVARRIRAGNGSGSDEVVTVLLLTSDDLGAKGAMARQAGAYCYLVKPIKRAELAVTAGAALGREPIKPAPARVEAPPAAPAPHPQTLRILLADDSPDNRALVHAYLKTTAWEIDDVEDGAQAVKKFTSEGPYDLVLMDIRMPVLDGYGATRAIRRWEREHGRVSTPIVALTASVFAEAVRKTREAGCTLHVAKPIKRQALLDVIGCVLGGVNEKVPPENPEAVRTSR
jgi:CheY-like chemotaxis protein